MSDGCYPPEHEVRHRCRDICSADMVPAESPLEGWNETPDVDHQHE